jgi:predicted aspartyl protease
MPTIEGQLDDVGFPLLALRLIPSTRPLTVLIDTGFDGELMVYHDDLHAAGVEAVFDRAVQARLADGSQVTLLGAMLTVDWFGEPQRIHADVVPAIRPAHAYPLIDCRLLRDSRLEIDFPRGIVLVSRA